MVPLTLLNGQLLPQAQTALALNDAGFVFGATVTDLCRTFRGVPYRWSEHLARFRRSGEATHIRVAFSDDQIAAWAHELIAHNAQGQELALVLFATAGPVGYYLGQPGGAGDGPPTFGMHTFPLPLARYRGLIEHGASLVVPSVRQVPAECVDPRVKQRSRLHWWLADQDVRQIQPGTGAPARHIGPAYRNGRGQLPHRPRRRGGFAPAGAHPRRHQSGRRRRNLHATWHRDRISADRAGRRTGRR